MAKGDKHSIIAQQNLVVDLVKQGKLYCKVQKEIRIPNCTVSRTIGRF